MTHSSIPGHVCHHMLFAVAVLVSISVFAPPAAAQNNTAWTITIDATGTPPTPTYSIKSKTLTGTGCSIKNTVADPLDICEGDTVQWLTKTSTNKNKTWIVHRQAIFDDSTNLPTHVFQYSDATPKGAGGPTDASAPMNVPDEYYIFVDDGKNLYHDDPNIIIGGTGMGDEIGQIIKQIQELESKAKNDAEKKDLIEKIMKYLDKLGKNPNAR